MSVVPSDRRLGMLLASSNGPLERCYTLFLNRTAADWLLLISFILLVQAKVPAFVDRFYDYEPILLVIFFVPLVVAALGLLRCRTECFVVLRGAASWTIGLCSGLACGLIAFVLMRAANVVMGNQRSAAYPRH